MNFKIKSKRFIRNTYKFNSYLGLLPDDVEKRRINFNPEIKPELLPFNRSKFLEYFGIKEDGKVFETLKENGKIDQRIKALIHQSGKAVTNAEIREIKDLTANQIEACDCTSGVTINTNCDGCGDVNFGVSGVTFNYNSTSSYTFPCFDGAVNYVLCTDGYGNVNWCPPQSGGTVSADTFISNFTLTNETNLQIFRNDGVSWNVDISGVTPYHYGEGYRAIEPRVTSQHQSYARGELSNVQGGYYNIVDLDSNFSFRS